MGINFLREHEVFEADHLFHAIQKHLPGLRMIPDSPFSEKEGGGPVQTIYIEIEKENGMDFTLDEIQVLRTALPEQIKAGVERLTHPIFMPRNEEEVLRNIMTLSRQLRYVNDIPQAVLSFDEQKEDGLYFTVILVRSVMEGAPSIQDLFAASSSSLKIFPDRVRCMGQLRRKYVKEATVLRVLVPSEAFLREDRSVDFYKAREYVVREMCRVVGEIRDFNGGMIHKQSELLNALKCSLGRLSEQQNLLIEKFFYSLLPMEMRAVLDPEPLKQFFLLLLQAKKTDLLQKKSDARRAMAVTPLYDPSMKKRLLDRIGKFHAAPYQLVSFHLDESDSSYAGYMLFSEDRELQNRFLSLFDC